MAEKKHPGKNHGKKPKQRMKPYIVHQYLLKETELSYWWMLKTALFGTNLTTSGPRKP